jgi:hypothetical protein
MVASYKIKVKSRFDVYLYNQIYEINWKENEISSEFIVHIASTLSYWFTTNGTTTNVYNLKLTTIGYAIRSMWSKRIF